jgi:hypothetical protein
VNYQYVNCWEDYNRFKTLYSILEGINKTIDIHRQSTPKDVLLDRLRDYTGSPYVVILDEVDQLQDRRLLYDLYRVQNLTMILIANNDTEVFSGVDDRLSSRLTTATRSTSTTTLIRNSLQSSPTASAGDSTRTQSVRTDSALSVRKQAETPASPSASFGMLPGTPTNTASMRFLQT